MRDTTGRFVGGNAPGSFWTDEREAELRRLAEHKEYSGSELAERLGCSRNAIIGKCKRLGIELNPPRVSNKPRRVKTRQAPSEPIRWPIKPEIKLELPKEPTSKTWIRFVKLRAWSCKWPVEGDPGPDMMCCGAKRVDDKPYCEHHCEIAYRGFS